MLGQECQHRALMPDDLAMNGGHLSAMFVPGECRGLVLDTPAGLQRPPEKIVVAPSSQRRSEVECLVEATKLQSHGAPDRIAAAAADTDSPGDQRDRPAMEQVRGIIRQSDSPVPAAEPAVY